MNFFDYLFISVVVLFTGLVFTADSIPYFQVNVKAKKVVSYIVIAVLTISIILAYFFGNVLTL